MDRVLADRRTTITFCLTSAVAYARLDLCIDDDQRETGRNQPPKPECPCESTTYVFACVAPSRRPQRRQGRRVTNRTLRYMVRSDGMAGVKDGTLRGCR
jgi:hypothetical protein